MKLGKRKAAVAKGTVALEVPELAAHKCTAYVPAIHVMICCVVWRLLPVRSKSELTKTWNSVASAQAPRAPIVIDQKWYGPRSYSVNGFY